MTGEPLTVPTMTRASLIVLELSTPAGPLSVLVAPEDGVVRASGFTDPGVLFGRLPLALRARGIAGASLSHPSLSAAQTLDASPADASPSDAVTRALATVRAAVSAYSAGELAALDRVPVAQDGSPFFAEVWRAMRTIPAGQTLSYTQLAARAGRRDAVRAAGSACAGNLLAPFVPCHRVVRSHGELGGYAYGVAVKRVLLEHEGALP